MTALKAKAQPASRHWGTERGQPLDRVYIDHFLDTHRGDLRGRVFEIGGTDYTRKFGRDVSDTVAFDIVAGDQIDIVGDLATGEGIASGSIDCALVLQTLMLVHDIQGAVDTIYRMLRPGGVALVTVNFLAPNCPDPCQGMWQWGITPNAARKLFVDRFGEGAVTVEPYGNYAVASAFLAGLADRDVVVDWWHHEPGYEIVTGIRAVKPKLSS